MSSPPPFRALKGPELSEQQRLLLANLDEGFAACEMLYDENGQPSDYRFLEINEAFERQTGLRAADILGKTARGLYPDVERTWIETFGRVAATGVAERFRNFSHNTGRYYETFAYSPEKSSVLILIRDVTARVRIDESISRSETRLRLALEVGKMATWSSNYVTGEYIWDGAMVDMLGYQPGVKASHEAWKARVHPDDVERVLAANRNSARLGGKFHAEYRIFSQKDELRWVEARGQTVADEYGKIVQSYGVMMDITDRIRDEQRQKESADMLRLALTASHSGYFDRDIVRQSSRWSIELAELYGFSPRTAPFSPEQWRSCVLPEDLPGAEADVEQAMRSGELKSEFRIVRQNDGEVRWLSARGKVLYDEQRNPVRMVGINTDITESKRVEEELRLAKERFELALRNSPIAVFSLDSDLRHTWVYNTTSGFNPSDVLGKNDFEILEDKRDAAVIDGIKREVLRTGVGQRVELLVHTSQGEKWFDTVFEPRFDAQGKVTGLRGATVDRTEQKLVEQKLEEERHLTEAVIEQMPCWVALIRGRDLTYQFVNSAFQALAPGRQMVGRPVAEVWPEVEGIEEICRTVLETGQPHSAADEPAMVPMADGRRAETRHFTWSLHPVRLPGEEQPGLLLSGWETTARKRAEDAVLRSEKLASVGRMATSVAHQINNPLTAVTNLLFLAREAEGLPDSSREYISMAQEELNRIAHFTRQSLGFYSEYTGPERVGLAGLLESTVEVFQAKVRGKQAKLVRSWKHEVEVAGVAGELRQLFSNLLANSLDAIEHGGTVRIKLSAVRHPATAERCARVSIADNGCGIPQRMHRQVFEPFFTTKGSVGTGLGLWVGKQLADKHGGRIQMRSAIAGPRRGTTFCVTLPMMAAAGVQ